MSYHFQKDKISIGVWINHFEGNFQSLLFKGMLDGASDNGVSIHFFDGRTLDAPELGQREHNVIYQHAHPNRFDGWLFNGSLFTNYLTPEKTIQLQEPFNSVPIINITMETPGITSVRCNNATGMKALVRHFIEDHNLKRIAFIKGPTTSQDAEDRYQAYLDTLKEFQIDFDPSIIFQGDFRYSGGWKFADKLIEMKKIPFDVALFANDEMAIFAMSSMQKRGIKIPNDLRLGGFDNLTHSYISNPSLTTVNQPVYEQGYRAVKLLVDKIEGKDVPLRNYLESRLVIRESCGCQLLGQHNAHNRKDFFNFYQVDDAAPENQPEGTIFDKKDEIISSTLRKINAVKADEKRITNFLQSLLDMINFDVKNLKNYPMSILLLNELLEISLEWENFNELWHEILINLKNEVRVFYHEVRQVSFIDGLFTSMFITLAKWLQYREERSTLHLRIFLFELPNTLGRIHSHMDKDSMIQIIKEELKNIGFKKAYLCLYQDGPYHINDIRSGMKGELRIAYDETKDYIETTEGYIYAIDKILPDQFITESQPYNILWMELFSFEEHFGFIGIEMLRHPLISYYIIREKISDSFYTAYLVERQLKANKQIENVNNQLMQERERYRDIAMMLPAIVIETGTDLKIQFINKAGMINLGMEPEESNAQSLEQYIPKEECDRFKACLSNKNNSAEIQAFDMSFINPDNQKKIPVTRLDPVYDSEGNLTILRWFALDLLPLASQNILPDNDFTKRYNISKREKEIMDLLIQGYRNKDIADKLFLAESTVKGHVSELYNKLGIGKKSELIEFINKSHVKSSGYQKYIYHLLSQLLNSK